MSASAARANPAGLPEATQLHYSLRVEWDPRDAIYVVTVPELPGCRTHGDTYETAIARAQEAIASWVSGATEDGEPLPAPRHYRDRPFAAASR